MRVRAVLFDWGGTLTPWHTIDFTSQWRSYALAFTGDAEEAERLAKEITAGEERGPRPAARGAGRAPAARGRRQCPDRGPPPRGRRRHRPPRPPGRAERVRGVLGAAHLH